MSKKIIISLVALGIFTSVGLIGYNFFAPESLKIAEITSAGSVSLVLSPTDPFLRPNEEKIISLKVDSGADKLTVVKFELNYDPAKLTVSNLAIGTWLTQPLVNPTISNGKISGIIGAKPDPDIANGGPELNRTGAGDLLTFKVKSTSYGTHALIFNNVATEALTMSNTTSTPNMLKATLGTNIQVKLATDLVGTNHKVDAFDFGEFISQYGRSSGSADFDSRNGVDAYDFGTFIADYGKTW